MWIALMIVLGLLALATLGLAVFEAVTHARGNPSPKLDRIRPVLAPLALAILIVWGIVVAYRRHRQISCRRAG